jgi:uncharacterized protein YxjI
MKLYVKQTPFSWMGRFYVKDGKGNDRFYVEGELDPSGHKLHIFDANKKEVAVIQNKLSGLRPRIEIRQNGTLTAEVLKKRSGLKSDYLIPGSDLTIRGDFRTHDYALMGGYGNALAVKIVTVDGVDFYEMDVSNTADEPKMLALGLVFDGALEGAK